jgi:hypothetical protein
MHQLHLSTTTANNNNNNNNNKTTFKSSQAETHVLVLKGTSVPKEWWIDAAKKGDQNACLVLRKMEEEEEKERKKEIERRVRERRHQNNMPTFCKKRTKKELAAFRRAKIIERAEQNATRKKRFQLDFAKSRSCFGLYTTF